MTDCPPTVVVLAGGSNSRFWPLKGKSLFPFCGVTLLERQLHALVEIGFRQIVVVGNPDNYESIQRIGRDFAEAIDFRVTVQQEARGMGDALLTLRPILEHAPSPVSVYVCQVHDVFDHSLHEQMLHAHFQDKSTAWIASYEVKGYFPGGYLIVDGDMNVANIVEKPSIGTEPSNLVNIVAHIHPDLNTILDQIEKAYRCGTSGDDHYERALAHLMERQCFKAVRYEGPWFPIKYPWHVLDVMRHSLDQLDTQVAEDAQIAESVCISGAVRISSGVRILDYATVVGPCYIGPNTLIGQYSNVRESMIGANCVIGLGSEVNRSYIGSNNRMHGAQALDSVLADSRGDGHHINLAAQVVTANFREDSGHVRSSIKGERVDTDRTKLGAIIGAGAFIGVGATLMPGVKIGEDSKIGANTNVLNDVPDRTKFYAKQDYVTQALPSPWRES